MTDQNQLDPSATKYIREAGSKVLLSALSGQERMITTTTKNPNRG